MEFVILLGTPLLGALTMGVWGERRWAPTANVGLSLVTFLAACALTSRIVAHGNLTVGREQFFIDAFNVFLVTLTAFVGLTTSLFSRPYMRIEAEHGRISARQLRLYHSMYQLFMATMLIALTTNNMGLMWVAMEAATLSTVLLVTLYRTPASLEAGWKYFILCGVGISQALFGTILMYFAAVLSGLLLNVAMYAVVRCKVLVEGSLQSSLPGRMMMGFGLLSVVLAAFFLWRQRDVKRLFAYSSIEHMGIIAFAFGMGGPVANFAALLHMTVHSLTKSSIFFAVGHAAQKAGSQLMDDIRGLITVNPTLGWGLMMGTLAILGTPPFGVFASEFLILTTAMKQQPWATPILLLALGVAFAAIFGRVQSMVFGDTSARRLPHPPSLIPVFTHLGLVLLLGFFIPPYLADWYRAAARL